MEYQRFGKHILLERIAAGGMAEVFKAKAFGVEGFEKVLAIKRILPHIASDKAFIEMFINEAKILSALSHSSVCQIFDLGQAEGAFFITMEYVSGKSLQTILQLFRKHGRTMPLTMAAFIVSRVCEGLDYVYHKVGLGGQPLRIVHRDVSPHNILVGHEGTVKVIDFGIAHAKVGAGGRPTTSQKLEGKFDYMSPEQVAGENVDHRSDVFSVGVCLYELTTNRHPFTGNTEFNTLENIRKLTPAPPSTINADCTPELDAIVLKSLEKMPSKRWERTGDLMEALQRFIVSKPPLFNATSLSQFMRRTFARDIEDERKKSEIYASVKLDAGSAPDDGATMPGMSEGMLAEMARVAAAKSADAPSSMSMPTVPPPAPLPSAAPAPPRAGAKRTIIGMPAVGQVAPAPPAHPVARPIGGLPAPGSLGVRRAISSVPPAVPPRPSTPPPPAPPRAHAAVRGPLPGDLAGKAATLLAVPTAGEQRLVAIPTMPGFPAVRAPAAPAPPPPSEDDLDFDDDEAPTSVLDDKLASIVRTLAGAAAPRPSAPPPLPIGSGEAGPDDQPIGLDVSLAQPTTGDVYEVEPIARGRAASGPSVAQPQKKKSSLGLAIAIAVAIVAVGVVVLLVLSRSKGGGTSSKDGAPLVAVIDAAVPEAGPSESDAGAKASDVAPPPEAAPAADAGVDAGPPPADAPSDAASEPAEAAAEAAAEEAVPPGDQATAAEEVPLVVVAPTPDAGTEPSPEDTAPSTTERDAGSSSSRDSGRERDTSSRRDTSSSERDTASPPRDTSRERDTSSPPPSGDTGKLSVIANPWAWIAIDGRDTNRKTPLVNYELSIGVHRVCLRTEEGQEHCTAVRITADQPARVVHNF